MLIPHWLKSLRNRLHRPVRARVSKKRRNQRVAPRNLTASVESLEERLLLAAAGPRLVSITPNTGVFDDAQGFQNGEVLETAPRELMFRFSEGQVIDPNTLLGIEIVRSGFDNVFLVDQQGNSVDNNPNFSGQVFDDSVKVEIGSIQIGERPNEVIVRFASTLVDDTYQIRFRGTGNTPLRNMDGARFNDGADQIFNFEVDRGAQIEAVVHQPVLRNQNLTVEDVSDLEDGATFTVQSGGAALQFEFVDASVMGSAAAAGNIAISYNSTTDSSTDVAMAIQMALNTQSTNLGAAFGITATATGDTVTIEGAAFSPIVALSNSADVALSVSDANLVQRENIINVYFNANDPLNAATAESPAFYRLISTDGTVLLPTNVTYNADAAVATLTFNDPNSPTTFTPLPMGTYNLRIGESFENDNRITVNPLTPNVRPVNLGTRDINTSLIRDDFIGGNPNVDFLDARDVDLYRFELLNTTTVSISLLTSNGLNAHVRLFNSTGAVIPMASEDYNSGVTTTPPIMITLNRGVYYIGVSSQGNINYNALDGSGVAPGMTVGSYRLKVDTTQPDAQFNVMDVGGGNATINTPQVLDPLSFTRLANSIITRSTELPHITVRGIGDNTFDFFSFQAKAGDKGIFDIDNAAFDSKLYLFDAAGNLLAFNDNFAADPGSLSLNEAFLQFTFATTDTYIIAVAGAASNASLTGGTITGAAPNGPYFLHVSVGGNNSSFDTASNLGNLGQAGNVVRDVEIEPEIDVILPPEPGGNDEPGHRDIPLNSDSPEGGGGENHLTNSNQGQTNAGPNNGRGMDPFVPNGIRTIAYNFQSLYGQDPSDNNLFNAITEEQKQRVREIFELFSMVSGVQFVEAASVAEAKAMGAQFNDILTIATGDIRALVAGAPTGPGGVEGLSGSNDTVGLLAVIDAGENFTPADNQYGGRFFRIAMHEIARLLGLNHALDLDAVLGTGEGGGLGIEPTANPLTVEGIFPGDHDIVHLRRLFRRDSVDIDMYKFNVIETGMVTIETLADRLDSASQLDTVLTLYRETQTVNGPLREIIARNDNYYGTDSFINLRLEAGTYYIGVSSVGNENYNPVVRDTGSFGRTDGAYELRLDIRPDATTAIVDVDGTPQPGGIARPATALDGDLDGNAGGIFDYAFQVGDTIFVDKGGVKDTGAPLGSLENPYSEIDLALAEAQARRNGSSPNAVDGDHIPVIVRIVGNSGTDGLLSTLGDNLAYEVGLDDNLVNRGALEDGGTFDVPQGVTVVIDGGAILKLQDVNIDVGSSAVGVDRSGGAVQILGTTFHNVTFTSWHDDSIGGDSDDVHPGPSAGDWGGIVYRGDSDYDFEYNQTIRNLGIPSGPNNTKISFNDFVFTDFPVDGNEATITFTAVANLANATEFLNVMIGVDGSMPIGMALFQGPGANPDGFAAGDVPVPLQFSRTFSREELRGLVGPDGKIKITVTPSANVDNLLFTESLTANLKVASAVPVFLNIVNHATITYAGGPVVVDSAQRDFDAIHLVDARPTITFNTITQSARAPISGNPDSFNDTFEDPRRYDHNRDRLGPKVHGNTVLDNSTNGLRVRTELQGGVPLETLTVPARFSSTDIVYVITENLLIEGGAGGLIIDQNIDPDLSGDDGIGRRDAGRLRIDPGVIVKLSQARIEALLGSSNFIAEGSPENPIIFTSLSDDTYGAGGTFDTNNDAVTTTVDLDFGAQGQDVWTAAGPGPITNAQVENIQPNNEVSGAIHAVVAHPTNPNILWVAAVNGGIWRTDNALDPNGPTWTPQIDFQESLSVSALVLDPTDPSGNTLVAGIGRTSSFGGPGGALSGLLRTTNGGQTWVPLDGDGLLRGRNISGIVARGNTIVVSATEFSFLGGIGGGVYRSTNGGQSFELLSGSGLSNLPTGTAFDITADPTDATGNTLYVSIQNRGLFRSDNGGATWINVSVNQASQLAAFQNTLNNNAEIAISPITGRVYVGVIVNGQPAYIGFSDNRGATWTEMDLPISLESDGELEGLSPRPKPGGQGFIHFSIVADPTNPDLVYIAGDRQDSPFPNAIGANDFTARIFRGDTSVAPIAPGSTTNTFSPQWEHMTHTQDLGFAGGGTASNSAPHADSRDLVFLANGMLVDGNDGGIYLRTSPQDNTGDWFSINGNLQVTELHDVAYDSVSNTLIGGAQDVGTMQQLASGSLTWDQVFLEGLPFRSGGDGGDVAVDDISRAAMGQSIRYSSSQNLGLFRRQIYDANGVLVPGSEVFIDTSAVVDPQFVTPIALNAVNPLRMIIGGAFSVYEFDQGLGTPITAIPGGQGVNSYNFNTRTKAEPIAYGHALNPDILYVGSGSEVYVRTSIGGALQATGFVGGFVNDIVLDADTPNTAYVVDENGVYITEDGGASWQEITGNLSQIAGNGGFSAVTFMDGSTELLIVGGRDGVFAMRTDQPNFWVEVGTDLPNAIVFDLEYDAVDDVLVASTMGRGAFLIENASITLSTGSGFQFDSTDPGRPQAAGDWGGIVFQGNSSGNLDYVEVRYGGGVTPIAGGFATFNPIEITQADVRISNSEFENNESGVNDVLTTNPNRNGRGANSEATIFIRGAQPTIVTNIFENNNGNVISVNVNALNAVVNPDLGRATGEVFSRPFFGSEELDVTTQFANNVGPLVRNNRMDNNTTNGMEVRGGILTTEGVWDDVDIVHVVRDEIIVTNLHTFGGLRLQSNARESLVVKLDGDTAGFRAAGTIDPRTGQPTEGIDIVDRIGGTLQIVGTPGRPVVLTSLSDNTVGAGFTPEGIPLLVTGGTGTDSGLQLGPEVNNGTLIDNDALANTEGFFEFLAGTGGSSSLGNAIIQGVNSLVDENFLFDFTNYIDVGSNGGGVNLGATTITQAATLIAPDVVQSSGSFQGANGTVNWIVTQSIDTGTGLLKNELTFTSANATALGNLRYINYLDQDILNFTNDVLQPVGTPGSPDFRLFTRNLDERVGLSQYGVFQQGLGLVNASYDGYAADEFPDLDSAITGAGATYSIAGTIDTTSLPPFFDPNLGPVFGPNDVTSAMAWSVDPSATTATITTFLELATPSGRGGSAGDWRGIVLDQGSNDRNVAVYSERERATGAITGGNSLPATAEFLGTLAPSQAAANDNARAGFEIHGFINSDDPSDKDVYSFTGQAGTEVWFDIDRTAGSLDTVLELVDANGVVLARSDNSLFEERDPSLITGIGLPMTKDERLGGDFYSTNPKDAGMRVVLPGAVVGQSNTYFIRVSSKGGLTNGEYQMQIRLRQTDEKPGSVVTFSDVRFADVGIQVNALPYRSPLVGEGAEESNDTNGGDTNNSTNTADFLGNILQSDMNAFRIAGNTFDRFDLDFYEFEIDYASIQQIPGFNLRRELTSLIFDIDYAGSSLGRADLNLYVFDEFGRLILTSMGSNVADDLPAPPQSIQGNDLDDQSRGSTDTQDPFIGSIELPEGRYYAAVAVNRNRATVLDQFTNPNSVSNLLRLQPVDSITRIAEDHIGTQGGQTVQDPSSLTGLADLSNENYDTSDPLTVRPTSTFVPWHLGDVGLVISRDPNLVNDSTEFYTVDPFTGEFETLINGNNGRDIRDFDIRRRTDSFGTGDIIGFSSLGLDAQTGNFLTIDSGTGAVRTSTPDDGIITSIAGAVPNNGAGVGMQYNAVSFTDGTEDGNQVGNFRNNDVRILAIASRNDDRYENIVWAFQGNGQQINSLIPPHPADLAAGTLTIPETNKIPLDVLATGSLEVRENLMGNAIAGEGDVITIALGGISGTFIGLNRLVFELDTNGAVTAGRTAVDITGLTTGEEIAQAIVDAINGTGMATAFVALDTDGNPTNIVSLDISGGDSFYGFETSNDFTTETYTGMSVVEGTLYVVSDIGGLYTMAVGDNTAVLTRVDTATDLVGIEFAGVTTGPPNVEGGIYESTLFAVTTFGELYAFDTTGKLQPVFLDGESSIQLRDEFGDPLGTASNPVHGISFSNLDENLWHATTDRAGDQGHLSGGTFGNTSLSFANERTTNAADNTYGFLAGGGHGTMVTDPFSLVGYSAADQPVLYFNYFLDTEDAAQQDILRVYAGTLDGTWTALASNAGVLFDNTAWRQARIDLSAFAGQEDLRLRFEFATAGSVDIGNIMTGGTELRALNGDRLRDADSFNIDGTVFEFDLGYTVVLPGGSQVIDGDLVTIDTPTGPMGATVSTVFEFDNDGVLNVGSNVRVAYTVTDSAVAIATAFREAVNNASLGITAIQNGQRVNLVDRAGAISTADFNETEANNTIGSAQNLENLAFTVDSDANIPDSTVIPHLTINGTGDGSFDYYSFTVAQEHDARFALRNVTGASQLFLYDTMGNLLDQGTGILTHNFDRAGTYIIGVARFGAMGAMGGIVGGELQIGDAYTLDVSIENHRYDNGGSHDVTNVTVTQVGAFPNGPGILLEGGDGVTPGRVSMLINAGMTDDQVADVMRRAIANQLIANPVPIETIKAYNEVIQVLGHTVFDEGRLGFTGSLPGSPPTFLDYLDTSVPGKPFPFNQNLRGQDNDHEGVYIDDIIIGFAERGEIVTGSPTQAQLGSTPLINIPILPGGTDIETGNYQLEIRRGTEYTLGSHPVGEQYRANLTDTNDRLIDGLTIRVPDGEALFDGQKFQLSDGINTVVFEFEDRELNVGDDTFGIDPTSDFAVEFRSFESAHVIASRLRNLLNSTPVRNALNITAALAEGTQTGENNGGRSAEINVFGNIVSSVSGTLNPRNLALDRNDTLETAQRLEDVGFNLIFNSNINDRFNNNTSKLIPHTTVAGTGNGTVDYYSFEANQGDEIIIDIDDANFDTEVILFDEYGNLIQLNDDLFTDSGSDSSLDSFIQLLIPRTGKYVIRVARFSGNGGAVAEVETNNSLGSAQDLEVEDFSRLFNSNINDSGNSTIIDTAAGITERISEAFGHVTISGTGDGTFDYYSFNVEADQRAFFDIDGATNTNTSLPIDTMLFLYDPRTGDLLASNDNRLFLDNGSTELLDPFIAHTFTEGGTYVIGVSRSGSTGNPGSIAGFPLISGDTYTLNIAIEGHDADVAPINAGQFYTMHVSVEDHATGEGRTNFFNVQGELEFQFFANLDNQFVNYGDSNVERLQGSIQISQNQITDSATSGIVVQEATRRSGNQVVGGSVSALPTVNNQRLARGVQISNNVVAGFTVAGIDLQGDGASGNVPLASVPFHRVISNTVYGGVTPAGTGIRINNTSPTLINNIIANTNIAIDLVGGVANTTVVSHGLYQNNGANDRAGVSAVNFPSTQKLFVDPTTNNFYLASVTQAISSQFGSAIDSARDGFEDRPEIVQVGASIGIPQSNLIAAEIDRFGQQRIDDPRIQNTGQGNKVFFDRGAVERVDFAGPTSGLIAPMDISMTPSPINPETDLDFRANFVRLVNQTVRQFIVGLDDLGIGIEDLTVFRDQDGNGIDELSNVKLLRKADGGTSFQLLQDQVDYLLRYNTNTKQITFDAASGVFPIGEYVVVLNTGRAISLINGQLQTDSSIPGFNVGLLFPATNPPIRDLAGNSLLPNRADGTTRFEIELQPAPTLTINDITILEGNDGDFPEVLLEVTLSADVGRVVSVDFAVEESLGLDAATLGTDFEATIMQGTLTFDTSDPNNRITFNPDGSLTLQIPIRALNDNTPDPNNRIRIIGDTMAERSEQFFVRLSNAVGATIGDSIGVVTINDDDLKIGVGNAQITEGDNGQKNLVFTASLLDVNGDPINSNDLPTFDVTFDFSTLANTATADVDFLTTMGTVTIPAGSSSATFSVPILGDLTQEALETFFVNLSNANGAAFVNPADPDGTGLSMSQVTGTIVDDDPKFSVSDVVVLEGDSGTKTVTFTVSASATPLPLSSPVTVKYRTQGVTAEDQSGDGDFDAVAGTLTFRPIDSNQNLDNAGFTLNLDPNIQNSATLPHISVNGSGDGRFDYYSFTVANAGAQGIFDIDLANFDSALFLYDLSGNLLASNQNATPNAGDDAQAVHPFINHTFAAAGTYVIGVAREGSTGTPSGITGTPPLLGDSYRLHVSLENHPLGTGPAVIAETGPGPLTKTVTVTVNADRVAEGDEQFVLVLENASQGEISTINEIEPNQTNNSILSAQNVDGASFSLDANANIQDATAVPHITINGTGDGTFDYYSFTVQAGSTVTFDIDGANFNTELFIYDLAGNLVDLGAQNDDGGMLDAGSTNVTDSFLEFTFAAAGTYVVGVGGFDSVGTTGGITGTAPQTGEVYSLNLSIENKLIAPGTPVVTENDSVQNVDGGPFGLGDNPNIQNATSVPHLSINGTGDGSFDYYSFTVTDNATVTFDIDGANFDTAIYIYDPATGDLIDPLAQNNDGGVADPGSTSATDSFLSYLFATGGTYVVGVGTAASVGAPGGITGIAPQTGDAYTLHLSIKDHPLKGGVATILDDDPRLTIDDVAINEGNSGTTEFEFTVTLTDGLGNAIVAADDILVDFNTSLGTAVPAAPGQIYESATASTFASPQALDPRAFVLTSNSNITDAQGVGTSTSIRHLSILGRGNGAFDYYSFNGTTGQRVILDIDGATFDSQIFVYDSLGNVVFSNDDGFVNGGPNGNARDAGSQSTEDAFLDFVLAGDGRYTIAVGRESSIPTPTGLTGDVLSAGDQYTLHVSIQNFFAPPGTIFETDLVSGAEIVPNNSLTAPRNLDGEHFNRTANANINNQANANISTTTPYVIIQGTGDGTADFYSFTAAAGQVGVFDIDGANFDSTLTLFGPSNNQISFNDDSAILDSGSTTTLDSLMQVVFSSSGTYKLRVGDLNQPSGTLSAGQTYRLNVAVGGHAEGTAPTFGGPTPVDGTATPNSDFNPNGTPSDGTAGNPGTLRIAQGQTTGTIKIQVTGDLTNEPPSENFFVRLFNARYENIAGVPAIQDGTGVGTILNDDAPVIRITDPAPVAEAGSLGTPNLVQFTVGLFNPDGTPRNADVETRVTFTTADGTAIAGMDYVATSGTAIIPVGQSTAQVTVQLIKDGVLNEGNETFFVNLTNPVGAVIDDAQGQGTIIDNTGFLEQVLTVVAPDAGRPGQVRVIDSATGNVRFEITPYGGFQGGIRIATGDVNNDGTPDIITAPGPGGGPHIKVFSGATGQEIASFFAFDSSFFGGLYVASGDFGEAGFPLGDSFDDIVVSADAGGGPRVSVFSSATTTANGREFAPQTIQNRVLYNFFVYDPRFNGGVRVAAGDVTGDGVDDLIVGAGPGGGPHVQVYDGLSRSTTSIRSFFAYNPSYTGGIYVAAGDVDRNTPTSGQAAEIITGPGGPGMGPLVRVFSVVNNAPGVQPPLVAEFLAYAAGFQGGVRVSAGDVNGDSFIDVITAPGPGGGPHVRGFNGQTLAGRTVANPPQEIASLFPYEPNFAGGLFVAGVVNPDLGQPLRAAQLNPQAAGANELTQDDVEAAVEAALDRLRVAGVSETELDELSQLYVTVSDLGGDLLALDRRGSLVLDVDAAGNGWFIDPTPHLDEEFAAEPGSSQLAAVDASAVGGTDLLTVVLHELGHKLGLADLHPHLHPDALMSATLPNGTRRLFGSDEMDDAFTDGSLFDSLLLD